jgi:molybdenum cofactor biosynthesis protein MoaC
MEHITKVRKRKEEYDAMPRYEQGNVMKEAARRILRESKSEMGILQVAPSAGQLALDQEKRKEVTKMRNVVRRNRQRLGKKEWQLEQMEKGQRVTNRAIDRRIQGLGRVDARIQSQWRGGQGYPADRWESQDLDMPRTKENLQHWPRENEQVGPSEIPHDLNEATDDDWAIDSVMDVRFARRPNAIQAPPPVDSESIRPPPSADSKAPRRSFSNMQAQALERALTGTTVVSSKERRQTFLERVLKPNQERDIQSEVGKSAAQIAIGKFARMKARIQSGRNSDVRYVGAPDQPSSQQFQRRTYHTEVRTNCIDAKYQHQLPYASQVQPTESSAVGLRSEVPVVKEEHVLIDPEAPVIDSDVFYRAFNEVFLQGRARITQLKGARRGRKLTLEDRHKRCMVAIEAAEPPLDIWNSLLLRWRLEIWHASVGLTENEIEEVGQVTIRRQTLARVVADAQKRRQEGRRRLRDDPLWQEIVHGRRVKDKDDLGRLGLDEEAAFVWWHVRTKYRAHTGSGTPLGDTKRQIAKMAAEKQQDNRRFAERSAAVISRAEQRLQEWEGTAEGLHRELWLIGLGVHQSNTGLRRIMDLEMVMTMDEVRGALRYWRSSRDRGRARTRLYDAFYMMQRDFHVGEEASLSSKLRQLRQFILRGDRLTTSSNARLSPEPIAQLVQATPLRNERSIAHRLAASERSFTKLSNQIDDVKMELFYIFTGQSPSDRRTMQYISVLTLRAAAQAYFGEVVWPAGAKASEVKSDRPIQNMPDQAVQSIPDQQAQSTPSQLLEPGSDTSDQQTGSGTRRLSLFDDRSSKPLVQQAGQQNSSTLDSQSEQGVEISDQQLGPGLRRLVFSNARELDIANTRPRSQRNARTPANGAGVVGRPNRPSKKPRFDDAGLISGAILRRFRQGKARYIAQLVAAERSAAANDAVQDGDEFEDGFHDFPHEADTPIYSNAAPFNSTKRLLAPLRRSVDVDELAPSKTGTAEPNKLTHLDASGEARMVSVAAKPDTRRVAIAVGRVCFSNDETHKLVTSAALKKGDVLAISRIAGIQAAKMCPSIIPLCHPIMISSVKVDVVPFKDDYASGIYIEGMVECTGPTGVEMEALTAVMGAALTVIDMVKAVDKAATIEGVKVVHKSGGKSGTWVDEEWQALKK